MYAKVLIASTDKNFRGLTGLVRLQTELNSSPERELLSRPIEENQEKVQNWLQTACIDWMKKTKNLDTVDLSPKKIFNQVVNPAKQNLQSIADEISNK